MVYCTIKETSTLLGYKSGATLYRLVGEGHLDEYLWNVEGKMYLYMGKRKGKRLAEKIKSLVFDKDGFEVFDFDPQKHMDRLNKFFL